MDRSRLKDCLLDLLIHPTDKIVRDQKQVKPFDRWLDQDGVSIHLFIYPWLWTTRTQEYVVDVSIQLFHQQDINLF